MGLVKPAGKCPPKGVPVQAPEAHSHPQHEEHECHEEGGCVLGRVSQSLPAVAAALTPAGHRLGDLRWTAPGGLQHLLMQAGDRPGGSPRQRHRRAVWVLGGCIACSFVL